MEAFNYKGTDDTPTIIMDPATGIFEISGRSMPEDVAAFYGPIVKWLEDYAASPSAKTVITFKLNYFNTASSKLLLDIMMKLEELQEDGGNVLIKWCYPANDEDMKDAGEEYADIVDVPFEQIEY